MTPELDKQLRHLIGYLGWSLIPIVPETKQPAIRWLEYCEKRASFDEVKSWVEHGWHLAVVTGEISNLIIVDDDRVKHGLKEFGFDSPVISQSKSGGRHYYYPYDREVHSHANGEIFVDIKGWHSYCLIPPFNGRAWIKSPQKEAMNKMADSPLGQEIVDLINSDKKEEWTKIEPTEFVDIKEGERTAKLYQLACSLFNTYSLDDGKRILFGVNQTYSPPISDKEFEYNVARAWKYVQDHPNIKLDVNGLKTKTVTETHFTDTGNAEKIVELFGDKVRFDHRRKRWLIWRDHRWQPDESGMISKLGVEMAKTRYKESAEISDSAEKLKAGKWAIQSESKQRIDAAISLAKSFEPIADDGKNWDSDNMLLGCPNGVIDLRTGTLRSGKQEDRITMSANTIFVQGSICPRWLQFLNEVFQGDENLIHYVHKALGYSVTGTTSEQVAFFCFGAGANGKGTLFRAVSNVLGDYSYDAPATLFQRNTQATSSNDVAATEFKRFLISSETLSSSKLNEQRLKGWTGGDKVTARYLYSEYFSFEPTVKPWIFTNHKPGVEDDSYGFWRRIRTIPFNRIFKPNERDNNIDNKLKVEAEGILCWLIDGCLLWQKEGLNPTPEIVKSATDEYQVENDELAGFIFDDCLEVEGETTKHGVLYNAYKQWATREGITEKEILSTNKFGRIMGDKFVKKPINGSPYYLGIILKNDGRSSRFDTNLPKVPYMRNIEYSLGKTDVNRLQTAFGDQRESLGTKSKTTDQLSDEEINSALGID